MGLSGRFPFWEKHPLGWPGWVRACYRQVWFQGQTENKTLYLTFDDGPDPTCTPRVLALLRMYGAQATFFCLGKHALAHPEIVRIMAQYGHTVGHHTSKHLNAWQTPWSRFWADVQQGQAEVQQAVGPATPVRWFRPPYGRLWPQQARKIFAHYPIALWTHLSGDYAPEFSQHDLYGRCWPPRPGATYVFHDRADTALRILPVLERFLIEASKEGYSFQALPLPSSPHYT